MNDADTLRLKFLEAFRLAAENSIGDSPGLGWFEAAQLARQWEAELAAQETAGGAHDR